MEQVVSKAESDNDDRLSDTESNHQASLCFQNQKQENVLSEICDVKSNNSVISNTHSELYEAPYRCRYCDFSAEHLSALIEHVKKEHPNYLCVF